MKRSFIQPGRLVSDQSVEVFFERERCETQRWLYQEMDLLVGRLFGRLKEQFFKEFDDNEEEGVDGGQTDSQKNPPGGFGPGPRPVSGLVSRSVTGSVPGSGTSSVLSSGPSPVPAFGAGFIFNGKRLDHIRPATLTPEELTQLILLQKSKSDKAQPQSSNQLSGQTHQPSSSTVQLSGLPRPVLFTTSSEQFTNNRRSPRLNRQTIYPNLDDDDEEEEEIPSKRCRNVLEPNGVDDDEVLHQVEVVHPPASMMMNSLERSGTGSSTTSTTNSRVSALSLLPRIVMTAEERERHLQELSRRLFDPNYVPEPQKNKTVPQKESEPEVKQEITDDDDDGNDDDDNVFDTNLVEVQLLEPLVQVEPKVKGEIEDDYDDADETGNFLERSATFKESNPSKTKTTEKLIGPDGQQFTYAGAKQSGQLFLLKPSSSDSAGQFAVLLQQQQSPSTSTSKTSSPGQLSRSNSSQLSGQLKAQDQARPDRVVTRNFNKTFNSNSNRNGTGLQLSGQLQTRSRSKASQSRQFIQSSTSTGQFTQSIPSSTTSTGQLQTRSRSKANQPTQFAQPSTTLTGQLSGQSLQPSTSSLQLTQSGPSTLTIQLLGLSQPSSSTNQPKSPTLKLTGLSPSTSEKLAQFLNHDDDNDHDYEESSNQAIQELIDEDNHNNHNNDTEVDTDLEDEPTDQVQQDPAAHVKELEASERLMNELKNNNNNTRKNAFNLFTISSLKCNQVNCLEMFLTTDELNHHLKAEHWILKFQCHLRYCGASFDSSAACLDHVSGEHGAVTVWYCARCPLDFKTYLLLKRHTVNYHEEGQFRCAKDGCEYGSSTRGPAICHYLKKHAAKKRVCDVPGCGKELYGSVQYRIHQRKHEGIRPFKCKWPNCTYTSTSKHCALSHIRVMHLKPKVVPPPSPPRRGRKKIPPKPVPTAASRSLVDPSIYLEVDKEMLNKERLKYKSLKKSGAVSTAAAD